MLTSQPRNPPTPATPVTACSRWCTTSYGPCQPRSYVPWSRMWPPTQSIATIPTIEMTDMTFGIALTSPRPNDWTQGVSRFARCRPMSSIFTMSATTP
ncbi:Uncharacterised protein [Mycobacteroides abscessus]|nr:Uncharacterised protein [Mycobacteroides abscessus]